MQKNQEAKVDINPVVFVITYHALNDNVCQFFQGKSVRVKGKENTSYMQQITIQIVAFNRHFLLCCLFGLTHVHVWVKTEN